jgi:thiol-disulfide isomerase/thioredoxin
MNGAVWVVSYVLLWIAVLVLGVAVVALLRQIGVLHTRVAPMGVNFAGEGPDLDQPAPDRAAHDYATVTTTLVAFVSDTCEICRALHPALERLARHDPGLVLRTMRVETDRPAFAAFGVRSTPYLVAVDSEGIVRSRGVANTLDQAEEMLAEVRAGVIDLAAPPSSVPASSVPASSVPPSSVPPSPAPPATHVTPAEDARP